MVISLELNILKHFEVTVFCVLLDCAPARVIGPPDEKTVFVVKKPLTIRCDATGDPEPVVNWYAGGSSKAMKNSSRIHILPDGALHFTKMRADDMGEYKCTALNSCDNSATYKTRLVFASKYSMWEN